MRILLKDAAARALDYLDGVQTRSVAPLPQAVAGLGRLNQPLPEQPSRPEEVLRVLDETCSDATMAMAGPRFFGFVIGGSLPAALAANWLASAWDQNSAYYQAMPATSYVEQVALRWVLELFHLPAACGGAFVTGGTMANFCALAAARHVVLKRAGWDVEASGLIGAPPVTLVISDEAHPSVTKSLGLLGFGRNRAVRVPTDPQGRMRATALPRISGPTIVCTQIGNVNTGAFDPVSDIAEVVHRQAAWLHVDGAFGLWAAAVPAMNRLVTGVALADSWATDFHKWLNVPFDSGLALVRDADALRAAMAITAEYLPTDSTFRNPADYVPELSRRARGVEVWAALRALGRAGVIELVERNCRQARRFAEGLRAAGYEILNDVVLNQVLVSFGDAQMTNKVIAAIQADGTCWCGGTVWQGRTAMRISVCSFATTDDDVELSLETMLRIAKKRKQ
ncbi:MAG: aspartate aminotransferase family protein [Gammaproteobacteria bacterium]|nr:aspartate aminotransferase family protein [Gammaproteobacteria bacterium]